MTEWLLLACAVLLVAANAVFVAAEFSLVTVDRAEVAQAARGGDQGAKSVAAALSTLSTQLSGAQLGITVTSLVVGFLAEPSLARLFRPVLAAVGLGEDAAVGVSVVMALLVATVVQMVLGELVPKNLAIARPLPVARRVAPAQRGFTRLSRPLLAVLNGSANRLVRAMGIEPQEELRSARAPGELASLVERSAAEGTLERPAAALLTRSLAFGERTAEDVLTPRVRMQALLGDAPVADVLTLTRRSGFSRFPVLGEGVDDIVGLVHVKHAVAVPAADRRSVRVRDVAVPALLVPERLHLDGLLELLRGRGLQMAVVVDEYGGTAGIVTLEDVVEELVGDIPDEHDRPGSRAQRQPDGSWSVSALLRLDEVRDLTGVVLPESAEYETLAGLVLAELGHLPARGETVQVPLVDAARAAGADGPSVVTLRVDQIAGTRLERITLLPDLRSGSREVDR